MLYTNGSWSILVLYGHGELWLVAGMGCVGRCSARRPLQSGRAGVSKGLALPLAYAVLGPLWVAWGLTARTRSTGVHVQACFAVVMRLALG